MTRVGSHHRARIFRGRRGFTLVELLVVVAMVGVLAALAMVGYRRYILSAQTSEAQALLQSIRVAQESYKSEALSYLAVSAALDGDSLYPRTQSELQTAGGKKASWEFPSHGDYDEWKALNVQSDGPVRFSYAVLVGLPGGTLPTAAVASKPAPEWANAFAAGPTAPWFVASAVADRDEDGVCAVLQTASFTNEVFIADDDE